MSLRSQHFRQVLKQGFTLIELLVVIAIIGILASVVLGRLTDARTNGADTAIKQSLSNVRAQSEIFYNNSGYTYVGFCDDPDILSMRSGMSSVNGAASTTCNTSSGAWAVSSILVSTSTEWCVDSTGFSGERTTVLGTGETACPSS